MHTVNIHEAKTHLSRLLLEVSNGKEVVIAKAGSPVARLVPLATAPQQRVFGKDAGLFEVPEDFDAPLPEEILQAFER